MLKLMGTDNQSCKQQSIIILAAILLGLSSLSTQAQTSPPLQEIIPKKTLPELESTPSPQLWRKVKLWRSLEEYQTTIDSLVFSPDSKILISGGGYNEPQMRFWSVETGEQLTTIRTQRTAVLAMAMSPNGKTLVSGGEDSRINIWNWRTGQYQMALHQHSGSITSLAIASDSKVLVSGALDGIRVWNLAYQPQRPVYTLAKIGNPTTVLAINPNDQLLASGDEQGNVRFWNIKQGKLLSEFSPHSEAVTGLAFSGDGQILITASRDRTIKIWDLVNGQLRQTLKGHTGEIRAIALHPSGKILASAGNDGIILWDLETGELLTKLGDHNNWVQSLAFSPNGRFLASGGFDFTVKIWENGFTANTHQPSVNNKDGTTGSDTSERKN
jgi:WD40 repeat protein